MGTLPLVNPQIVHHITRRMSSTIIRQNFHEDCEKLLNKQINLEMYASNMYLSLYSYFIQHDKALPGFAKMFFKSSEEERGHSVTLIDYLAKRGGKVVMEDVKKPDFELTTAKKAVELALNLEKDVNQALIDLHEVAEDKKDGHLVDFLEEHFLEEQVDSIKDLADLLTRCEMAGEGIGVLFIDQELKKKFDKQ